MPISRDKSIQGTHYVECWRDHPECAVAEIERLRAAINGIAPTLRAQLRSGLKWDPKQVNTILELESK